MSPNDILRLAGINAEITPVVTVVADIPQNYSNVKYALVNAIEHYNHEYERNSSPNVKQIYSELISHLDKTLGFVISNQQDNACELFDELDDKIKALIIGDYDCVADYFKCKTQCSEPEPVQTAPEVVVSAPVAITPAKEMPEKTQEKSDDERQPADKKEDKKDEQEEVVVKKVKRKRVTEAAKLPTVLDEPKKPEYEDSPKVKVPTNIINDIKLQIKELDDGNNHEYTSHLSGYDVLNFRHTIIKNALNQILDYLTHSDEVQLAQAAIYLTSLDSATRQYVPASIWKFLAVDYSQNPSIKDRYSVLKKVKI